MSVFADARRYAQRRPGVTLAMTWWERWAFNLLHPMVAATGIVYFCMKHLMATTDPFAVVNHPWQPAMLAVHIVAAPFFVVFFGMLFPDARPAQAPVGESPEPAVGVDVAAELLGDGAHRLRITGQPAAPPRRAGQDLDQVTAANDRERPLL